MFEGSGRQQNALTREGDTIRSANYSNETKE